jgi:uncharacterized membrane protein YfcA
MKRTHKTIFYFLLIIAAGVLFLNFRYADAGSASPVIFVYAFLLICIAFRFLFKARLKSKDGDATNIKGGRRKSWILVLGALVGIVFWLTCFYYLGSQAKHLH